MEMNLGGTRIHRCWAPHPCMVLGARVGRETLGCSPMFLCVVLGARVGGETSGCSPVFLPWASQVVGHLPSGVNPSLLSIARKGHFGAEGEKIAVTWAPLSRPKPFTPRGFPWLCSTQGWARRPGYTPAAAECMPQSLAAGEAAEKESCRLVTQSCLTLCNPMECSTPGFPVHEISHGGVDCCFLLQGILPTQGLPHYRKIVYPWATWKTPGKGRIAPKPGTRFTHSQLILLKTTGSQDPDARPKGCKKLVRQRPCHKWNHPWCMTWLPGWVCMRPGHPVSPGKAVTCVLSHLVAGARPLPPPHHRYWLPHKLMVYNFTGFSFLRGSSHIHPVSLNLERQWEPQNASYSLKGRAWVGLQPPHQQTTSTSQSEAPWPSSLSDV